MLVAAFLLIAVTDLLLVVAFVALRTQAKEHKQFRELTVATITLCQKRIELLERANEL